MPAPAPHPRPRRLLAALLVSSLALLPVGAARAATPPPEDAVQLAKLHFALGRTHVKRKEYDAAIREFWTGYQLMPSPMFLYNIGQVARLAGENQKALDAFERYVASDPNASDRAEVERWIAALRQAVADEKAAHPTSAASPPAANGAASASIGAPADAAAPATVVARPPGKKSRRTLWIVLGTVGAALVVGGVATAIALSVHGGSDIPGGYHDLGALGLGQK
jgi:tetratricopeptide (TPR) repeat protein